MDKTVAEAISCINELEAHMPKGKYVITGDIRKLSAKLFRQIEDKSIKNIFSICEELLEQHTWALSVIAYDFAYRVRNQYNESTYDVFFRWLKAYVRGWGDCDGINPLEIADRIMLDEHDLVLKGYGWMLKALSQVDVSCVEEYLIENHERMPRVAYRYALEKFDKDVRSRLMKL